MRNSLLITVLVGILIGIGYVTRHQPLLEERTRLQAEQAQLVERARLNRESALAYIQTLTTQRDTLSATITNLPNPLPATVSASDALRTLRELSASTGFILTSLTLTEPTAAFPVQELTISVAGSGVFAESTAFLRGVQRNAGAIRVNNVSLRPSDTGPDPVIDMNLSVSFLYTNTQGGL